MKITLKIDDKLLKEARQLTQIESETDLVQAGLKALIVARITTQEHVMQDPQPAGIDPQSESIKKNFLLQGLKALAAKINVWRLVQIGEAVLQLKFLKRNSSQKKIKIRIPKDLAQKLLLISRTDPQSRSIKADLIHEGLKTLIAKEHARRLIQLGGTEPQLKPIKRRRF